MEIKKKVNIHNRFDIEVRDAKSGELKQSATAYNIVLDSIYSRLCNFQVYFANIHFGTGTGTVSPTRTTLFAHLNTKTAINVELRRDIKNNDVFWKRKIEIMPEEFVGQNLTEVGIAFGTTNTNLVTHALIEDSEGNPISVLKTDLDVVTIYATVFFDLSTPHENIKFIGQPNSNSLFNYLVGNTTFPTQSFYVGRAGAAVDNSNNTLMANPALGQSATVTVANWIKDVPNKKTTTPVRRFDINTGNGEIFEIGFGNTLTNGVFRSVMPIPGIYNGYNTVGDLLGLGDGNNSEFVINKTVESLNNIYIDDVPTVDYTFINGISGELYKITSPTIAGIGNECDFSSDGAYLAIAHITSPFVTIYKHSNGQLTRLPDPTVLPTNTARICKFSPDGVYLAVGYDSSPYAIIYKRDGDMFTALTNPTGITTGINGGDFSPDGVYLALTSGNNSANHIYKRDGDMFTKLSTPVFNTNAYSCAFSPDGTHLVSVHPGSPYIKLYKFENDVLTDLPSPTGGLPTNQAQSRAFSSDGEHLVVGAFSPPYIYIYKRNGDSYARLPDPIGASLIGRGLSFSPDGAILAFAITDAPYIITYRRDGDIYTRLPDVLNSLVAYSNGQGCSFSPDGNIIALAHSTTPFFSMFGVGKKTTITFNSPPAKNAQVKADYNISSIPKDINHVLDLQFSIQFGEVVPTP